MIEPVVEVVEVSDAAGVDTAAVVVTDVSSVVIVGLDFMMNTTLPDETMDTWKMVYCPGFLNI